MSTNDNVVPWGGVTRHDIPATRVLEAAETVCMDTVVVIGYDDDGEFYFASSAADGGKVLWLLEMARKQLLEMGDEG